MTFELISEFNVLQKALLVAFIPLLITSIGCEKNGASYDDSSQRAAVESFSKANFRGDTSLAFEMLSESDQKAISKPLKENQSLTTYLGDKPWSLLTIVEATNPYDIKTITPKTSFSTEPAEGTTSEVIVQRYNGTPQRYTLVWQNGLWKISLSHQKRG